ncbi:MAG: hypothetical protein MZV70_77345 [Desulfobacterales bacterium]|nr:hypothetical protein [Desulfobacterales bacterium]
MDADLEVGDELDPGHGLRPVRPGRPSRPPSRCSCSGCAKRSVSEIFADYSERVGELVTGTVQQIDKGNILVNLGRTEATACPSANRSEKSGIARARTYAACIVEVKNNPQRAHGHHLPHLSGIPCPAFRA